MHRQVIGRRSWRYQVHELFSDPMGSPEVWNEISSYDGRVFTPKDWCNLAFDTAHSGHLRFLKWLIIAKKVPILIRNGKGCNLLHAAVSFGQESIAEWLVSRDENYDSALELFLGKSKRKRTALEVAVRSNRFSMVGCLLKIDLMVGTSTLTSHALNVVRHCCQVAERPMTDYITKYLQTLEILVFLYDVRVHGGQDVESLNAHVSVYSWWDNVGNIEWNEDEKFALYTALLSAAMTQNVDLVEWLLNKWAVSLQPPSLYKWKGFSIADLVVSSNVDDKEFLEDCTRDVEDVNVWLHPHSKMRFDMMVSERWKDGQSCSLIATLKPLLYKDDQLYLKNNWFEVLCEHGYEGRLAVLKILSQKYADDGAQSYSLPRLDLVVACGELHTLQWLIDSQFFNINAPLSINTGAVAMQDEDEVMAADDNICAICYCAKRLPEELQCGHSFCLCCIRQVHSYAHNNMQSFQCPYCRRHITAPSTMILSASLQYYLALKSPWLQFQSSNTIGQVLMALAAGTGSVFILEYLIIQQHIDPLTTFFVHGRNVLHVAASRGNIVVCKWLCLNGFLELAGRPSDEQLSPVHEAINCPIRSASLVFDLFEQLQVLPDDWIALASTSPNPGIVERAEFFLSHKRSTYVNKLLALNASLDQLTPVIKESSFGRCEILDEKFSRSMMKSIIRHGRADVLRWMYESSLKWRQWYFDSQKEFICTTIGKCKVNRSAMDALIDDICAVDKFHHQIAMYTNCFSKLIRKGATVAEIEEVINQQNILLGQAQNLNLTSDAYKISFENIIRHGRNALKTAAHHVHRHLIEWILRMPNSNSEQLIKQVFSQAVADGNSILFDFALSLLDKYNWPIPTSIDASGDKHSPFLHAVLQQFAFCCSGFMSDKQPKVLQACFEMTESLLHRMDIDVNVLNDENQTVLYHLARILYCRERSKAFQNPFEDISNWILKMIQMLVDSGINLRNIDDNNCTFFERVLSEGSPVLLKSVRWLALEKGLDVQFINFSFFGVNPELRQQIEYDFNAIREEQRALQREGSVEQ